PMRDHAGLAAPGAGQDEQRTFRVGNGFSLLGIEALEKIHAERGSYCYLSTSEPRNGKAFRAMCARKSSGYCPTFGCGHMIPDEQSHFAAASASWNPGPFLSEQSQIRNSRISLSLSQINLRVNGFGILLRRPT